MSVSWSKKQVLDAFAAANEYGGDGTTRPQDVVGRATVKGLNKLKQKKEKKV